jgi:hyperosmotically inducible protein
MTEVSRECSFAPPQANTSESSGKPAGLASIYRNRKFNAEKGARTLNYQSMVRRHLIIVCATILAGMLLLLGCNRQNQHPDVKGSVDSAMTSNGLGVVNVSQDRDKGVLTLSGDVDSADQKAQAEQIARQTAPSYTIANEIGVRPIGAESQAKSVDSSLDDGIENNYKAALKAHKNLDDQSISYDAKNGTLVLKGSVKTRAQKTEADQIAKAVPNVTEVVNEIEVKPDKHSTSD